MTFCPPILHHDVAAHCEASIVQTSVDRRHEESPPVLQSGGEKTDHRRPWLRLLRVQVTNRRRRYYGGDKVSAPHSITSSARARSDAGMVRRSVFAVFRLMISSTRMAWSIGRSPGFVPLTILST